MHFIWQQLLHLSASVLLKSWMSTQDSHTESGCKTCGAMLNVGVTFEQEAV